MSYDPASDPVLQEFDRFRRRQNRRAKQFLVTICLFWVSTVTAITILGHFGRVDVIADIGIAIGIPGIVLGCCLIVYLLSRPPFSTGEWKGVIKDLPRLLRR